MNEWIIRFADAQALEEIKKIGFHIHGAKLDSIVIMKSSKSREEVLAIDGVISCSQVDIFNLKSVGGAIIW